jgi:peptidoglycan/LPS O-acetylase OafA/YrhL
MAEVDGGSALVSVIGTRARAEGLESESVPSPEPADAADGGLAVSGWDGYRPYLDGLRAVAVYLVVLFHAGSGWFPGGFIGVDVFFVLSGFLVTRLLLRDVVGQGRVQFSRFYSRRFRRLLPAAFVTLIVTALVFTAVASPVEVVDSVGGFKAAFLYVTNWYFIHQAAGYFGANVSGNPVLHFWSLAVEEQFYLLWPLLLTGLFVVGRRFRSHQLTIVRWVVLVGACTSLLWAWSLRTSNPDRAYYGTDARAYQLLAGALLALSPALIAALARRARAARALALVALAGTVVTALSWSSYDPIERGTIITVVTVALIASLEAARTGAAARVLSTQTLVYLGQISYGTYLWHWPVIVVLTRTVHPTTTATIALTLLIATALASLSYQVLEHPIRASKILDRHRRTVIAIGLATSIAAAVILIPAITKPDTTTTATAANLTTGFTPVPAGLDFNAIEHDVPAFTNCYGKDPSACTLMHGTGPHLLLIGDSHAAMLTPMFRTIAQDHNLTLSVSDLGGCPWQRNLYASPLVVGSETVTVEDCQRIKDDLYDRVIPALHPDVIVTMNMGYETEARVVHYLGPDRGPMPKSSPQYDAWLQQTTVDSLRQLRSGNTNVVLMEPIPFDITFDPTICLSGAKVLEQCRYTVPPGPSDLEKLYRQLDQQDEHVWSLDIDKLVCPYLPICDPIVNQLVVKFDATHLTRAFAKSIAPAVDDFLVNNGVIAAGSN